MPPPLPPSLAKTVDLQGGSNPVWALRLYTLEVLQTRCHAGFALVCRDFLASETVYGRDRTCPVCSPRATPGIRPHLGGHLPDLLKRVPVQPPPAHRFRNAWRPRSVAAPRTLRDGARVRWSGAVARKARLAAAATVLEPRGGQDPSPLATTTMLSALRKSVGEGSLRSWRTHGNVLGCDRGRSSTC